MIITWKLFKQYARIESRLKKLDFEKVNNSHYKLNTFFFTCILKFKTRNETIITHNDKVKCRYVEVNTSINLKQKVLRLNFNETELGKAQFRELCEQRENIVKAIENFQEWCEKNKGEK